MSIFQLTNEPELGRFNILFNDLVKDYFPLF